MQSHFLIALLLVAFASFASAVSDENICDVQCEFCCREKTCHSESDCKGNFEPFIILGAVAGGIIGLFVLRKLYTYMKGKNPQPRDGKRQPRSRSRNSSRPKKESKPSSKPGKKAPKEGAQKKEEVYLQIDNESIVGVESNGKPDQEQQKSQILLNDKKTSSKPEISSKSRLEGEDKANTNRSDKKRESSAPRSKTPNKTDMKKSGTSATGKKQSTKKPATGAKGSGSSKPEAPGERGRSANSNGKERSGSQPKKSGASNGDKAKPAKK
jgi:hypothetical protein